MNPLFQRTKSLAPIPQFELWSLCARVQPGAFYAAGRAQYLPVFESEMAEFLAATQLDRYVWRKADPATGRIEVVCCTFSLLLTALVEQERLRQGAPYPLAFARVEAITDAGGHSLCGFFNENREWRIVEPQNDGLYTIARANALYPGLQIQNLMFV